MSKTQQLLLRVRENSLNYIRNFYNMPWLKEGLRVEYQGKSGVITGFIISYIQVRLDGETVAQPCHPKWEMKYFDADGNVLADFTEKKARIIFVGVHNKPHLTPLHASTKSGKVIQEVIGKLPATYEIVKTNIYDVEYLPGPEEADSLIMAWKDAYQPTEEDIIVALGSHVQKVFKSYFPVVLKVVNAPHPAQRGNQVKRENYVVALVQAVNNRLK